MVHLFWFQPLDLCSSDRTLLLSEEMILHQADLLPAKVPKGGHYQSCAQSKDTKTPGLWYWSILVLNCVQSKDTN